MSISITVQQVDILINNFLLVMAQPFRVVIPDSVSLAAPTTGLIMCSVMEMKTVLRTALIFPGEMKTVIQQRLRKSYAKVIFIYYIIFICFGFNWIIKFSNIKNIQLCTPYACRSFKKRINVC